MTPLRPAAVQVLVLGITQTVAWASSVYLVAIVAVPIGRDLSVRDTTVYGAFSLALAISAALGPAIGKAIDRNGGRAVLAASNIVLALGLALVAASPSVGFLFAAWCVLGVGMAMGLYDTAFAALVRMHGQAARGPITGVTLIAGFASTVGWPLSTLLNGQIGWRATCIAWALLHILLCLPLNLRAVSAAPRKLPGQRSSSWPKNAGGTSTSVARPDLALMILFFAATAFVTSAMAAHLPGLLLAAGAGTATAIAAASLVGPAQVGARAVEYVAARRLRFHPVVTARVATALHPVGGALLWLTGGVPLGISSFALLHGAGNGLITIAKGTLPLAVFGDTGYGHRLGVLNVLARAMQAAAPFAFGLVLDRFGVHGALAVSIAVSLVALIALAGLRSRAKEQ
ncbi:MAG: MFS transporter [Burkholderiales bacterium]